MKAIDKIDLIDRIGRDLQSRMGYSDIDVFLTAHGVNCKDHQPSTNSKWVYVKELLADASEALILKIANELEIEHNYSTVTPREATFWKAGQFKLFLSHLASFKVKTANLQHALKKYAISAFVAHEDIEPSREWQVEIEAALHTMDAMVALLMPGFKESNWCDQEIGVAVGRDVLIIPVRRGLDPYGFIGKYQGIQANNKTIGEVAEAIYRTLATSEKTRAKLVRSIANAIAQSTDEPDALEKLALLQNLAEVPIGTLESLREGVAENSLLIESSAFIEKLNEVFAKYSVEEIKKSSVKTQEWDDDIPF